jgi:hypothetical protein
MSNVYFDHYEDDLGVVDNELSLNSDGFAELTDELEKLFDKFGKGRHHDMSVNSFDEIRLDLLEHFNEVANSTTKEDS